ncbi:TPA: hypothetical protein KOO82_002819 [Clostridioides difficile]|nr:hypothetical protein [Clostridioides difficile]MCJ0090495.1 hypothetical protein [Clostridioides difficile]MCP8344707.1 hypothetical protein [Clostridioides difficile]MCP8652078.1 hypothetical protein [Clostridioides difficile]VIB62710.1 Uncharacterised protein [Clostridioides difficile]HBE9530201.1 hypothetical protein [Clostridioides difficile]
MNILGGLMLLGIGIVVGRVYEYRLNLKECENCDNIGGFKNEKRGLR